MFTYSQADWNLQVLPIHNNNKYFISIDNKLRKAQLNYLGLYQTCFTNCQHDIFTGYVNLKNRALFLFTSFFAKNWEHNNCVLHKLIRKFLLQPSIFPIFRKNFNLIKKTFEEITMINEFEQEILIKNWKKIIKEIFINQWTLKLNNNIQKSNQNWALNLKMLNYQPHYRKIFKIGNNLSNKEIKNIINILFDLDKWNKKDTCPKCL
jgi:hypothetical protein